MIRFTASALADVDDAISFLADRAPRAADRLRERLEISISRLERFSDIGRHGRVSGTRELLAVGTPYIVVYRKSGNHIDIVAVRHERRKWPDHFAD